MSICCLIGGGRAREAEEEQEAADEQRRVVRVDDGPDHEADVHECDPRRNRQQTTGLASASSAATSASGTGRASRRATRTPAGRTGNTATVEITMAMTARQPKCPSMNGVVQSHVARHHQHRRRGKVGQRPADRDVDEQQSERGVAQRSPTD